VSKRQPEKLSGRPVRQENGVNPNLDSHPSEVLDLITLEAVRAEVARRAKAARTAWRLEPAGAGLLQAQTLDLLGRWLDAQIADALTAMDLDLNSRYTLTQAGSQALAASEKEAAA
jgi:hypothetical protein